jgi:hypothetical protein
MTNPVAYRWKGELFTPGEIEMLEVDDAVPLYEHPGCSERNKLAAWMMQRGYATGHGDTMEQLLDALTEALK